MTSLELVRELVAHGADINARITKHVSGLNRLNNLGGTPYLLAARTADIALMQTLVELGGDPLLRTADNSTPLMAAAGLGTVSPGEDPGTESEVLEAVEFALKLGDDINVVNDDGDTAMHGAAYKNAPLVVKYLASHGAGIALWNRPNKHGWTPLVIAEGHRFGNFKPSPPTVAALHEVMQSAGVKIPPPTPRVLENNSDYVKKKQ
jgi:ankyrin repeat protein